MNTKLIMLPNPILVNNKKEYHSKSGDFWYDIFLQKIQYCDSDGSVGLLRGKKIIAGIEGLPKLDLSVIAEEIGWVDIEKLADEYVKMQGTHEKPEITKHDFIQGFMKAAQSLNEKKFSEKDLYGLLKLIGQKGYYVECDGTVYANAFDGGDVVDVVREYSQSISKPKEYNVQYIQEGNTIKVTKIL